MASCLNDTTLMESQCAEIAAAETASVADQAEFHFTDRRYSSEFFIGRMIRSHIGKAVHIIHFLLGKWFRRWILNHIKMVRIRFHQTFAGIGIRILILGVETLGIEKLVFFHCFVGFQHDCIINAVQTLHFADSSVKIGQIFDIESGIQCFCNLNDRAFPHSIGNQICSGIQKDGAFQTV